MSNEDVLRMDAAALRDELPRTRLALEEAERHFGRNGSAYRDAVDRLRKLDIRLTQLVHQHATSQAKTPHSDEEVNV